MSVQFCVWLYVTQHCAVFSHVIYHHMFGMPYRTQDQGRVRTGIPPGTRPFLGDRTQC